MSAAADAVSDGPRLRAASPTALSALLDLAPPLAGRLRDCPRVAPRLALLASRRLGPLPDPLTAAQEHMLRMDSAGLQALSLHAGAVRHARAVLRVIDGAALRDLVSAIGADARAAALRWHSLGLEAPQAGDAMPIGERVGRAGQRCLHGWCDLQPPAIGARVRLLLPGGSPGGLPGGTEAALGARIVEALVGAES